DEHQECQSPNEQRDALRMARQMVVLDRKPYSKEEREQREGFEVDGNHQKRVQRSVKLAAINPTAQELLEDRDPELGGDVNCHHTEKCDASHHVDREDAFRRSYGTSICGRAGLQFLAF